MAVDPKSLSNLYQDQEDVARCFAQIVQAITRSADFFAGDFRKYQLHLGEAYCLLWQDAETGEMDGRKVGLQLKIGVFAALFVDLCAAKRIEVTEHEGDPQIEIIDMTSTGTILDIAVFDGLRASCRNGRLRESSLTKWLLRADDVECVEIMFSSLVLRGILEEKSSGMLGLKLFKRFPTVDPTPERELEDELKRVVFGSERPESYVLSLLALCREADLIFMDCDPILRKHFSAVEYVVAKQNIDQIIRDCLGY